MSESIPQSNQGKADANLNPSAHAASATTDAAPRQFPTRRFRKISSGRNETDKSDRTNSGKAEKVLIKKVLPLIGMMLLVGAASTAIYSSDEAMAKIRLLIAFLQHSSNLGPAYAYPGILDWSIPSWRTLLPIACGSLLIGVALFLSRTVKSLILHSALLLSWLVLAVWISIALVYDSNATIFILYIVISSVVYGVLHARSVTSNFVGESRIMRRLSSGLIIANFALYYSLSLFIICGNFGPHLLMLAITLLLAAYQLSSMVFAARKNITYNQSPHLLIAGFLVCMVPALILYPPLRLRNILDLLPLFTICYAGYLAFYSSRMRSQTAIGVSLLVLISSALYYYYLWAVHLIPSILATVAHLSWPVFYDSSIIGIFLIGITLFILHHLNRNYNVLPKFGFERGSYVKFLMSVALITIYLTGFLLLYYTLKSSLKSTDYVFWTCSSYTALYCSAMLIWLALRKSWFLKFMLLASTLVLAIHLIITYVQAINLRNGYSYFGVLDRSALLLHLAMVMSFLVLFCSIAAKVKPVFANKVHAQFYCFYLPLLLTFICLIEIDQYMALTGQPDNGAMDAILNKSHLFPWSYTLIVCSLLYLICGFMYKLNLLRIFALLLLFMAVLKIIFYDVSELTASSKSLCMLLLGAGTLIVSYIYPKIKSHFARAAARRV